MIPNRDVDRWHAVLSSDAPISRPPTPEHERQRSGCRPHSRSRLKERAYRLPDGMSEISESDYFGRVTSFGYGPRKRRIRRVVREAGSGAGIHGVAQYADELSSERSRR